MERKLSSDARSARPRALSDLLAESPWFPNLGDAERLRIPSEIVVKSFLPGSYVTREGDRPAYWYGLIDGFLKIQTTGRNGRCLTFTTICTGAWFGEGTVLKRVLYEYDAIAVAVPSTRVACIPVATFERLVETSLPFNRFLLVQLNERLGQFIGRFAAQTILSTDARVAQALATIFNSRLYPAMKRHLTISQEEIANLSGISRPRCNEALHRLKTAGLIRTEYGGITIVDLPRLLSFDD
jgi:CRP/FNR family transcriptional regulator, cyclic AMP receptor protein